MSASLASRVHLGLASLSLCAAAAIAMPAGCGTSAAALCDDFCDCQGCSETELDECVDAAEDAEKRAEDEGCEDQFDDYRSCIADEMECRDGAVDIDGCEKETTELAKCGAGIGIAGGYSAAAYCAMFCDCEGCGGEERQDCEEDMSDIIETAEQAGCSAELGAAFTCVTTSATCVDGDFETDSCEEQGEAVGDCIDGNSGGGKPPSPPPDGTDPSEPAPAPEPEPGGG